MYTYVEPVMYTYVELVMYTDVELVMYTFSIINKASVHSV
jgi:hypothetical protein